MSKSKLERRFNKLGRLQPTETRIDDVEQKRLAKVVVLDAFSATPYPSSGYDDANVAVLPSKKRKVKVKYDSFVKPDAARLSKKEKKRLEKIVESREKKKTRQEIFRMLQRNRATDKEREQFVSIVNPRSESRANDSVSAKAAGLKINSISGSNKKRKEDESAASGGVEEEESDSAHDDDVDEDDDIDHMDVSTSNPIDGDEETVTPEQAEDQEPELDEASDNVAASDASVVTSAVSTAPSVAVDRRPAFFVTVERRPEVEASRSKLPIIEEEQRIVETIYENPVTIICGETGSGKTTQVPQFLYEAGYCRSGSMMAVTEPRRVAAVAMATRVAEEMSLENGSKVAYQIRYEKTSDSSTEIKFMTDGVLLKEIQSDFLLSKYSVVVIDEAHERSVYSDILIGLLSRIVPLRTKRGSPLKLIIMSATLRVEDFTQNPRLFKIAPPCLRVDSRQFPVTVHFNKKTPDDFVEEAFKKTYKIHRTLPDGGILVFVTGRQEVNRLCSELRRAFPVNKKSKTEPGREKDSEATGKNTKNKNKSTGSKGEDSTPTPALPKIDLDNYLIIPEDEESAVDTSLKRKNDDYVDEFDPEDDDYDNPSSLNHSSEPSPPLHVLPLYSLLSPERQRLVFAPPPAGRRLCVVATNVAETSLTIPGVRYVVDCGKVKTRVYDRVTGVSAFSVTWTSQASANQRAGRAGRTAPGHCYRLYSSAIFNDEFPKFAPPEMTMRPVDDLFLHMKDLGIDKVINFPFPTPPSTEALLAAERLLLSLGALEEDARVSLLRRTTRKPIEPEKYPPKITKLGKIMALFPISPRYSKMLAMGHQHGCLPYVIAAISALTVQEVFFHDSFDADETSVESGVVTFSRPLREMRQKLAGVGHRRMLGDLMVLLKAVGAAEYEGCSEGFCKKFGLRRKAMMEISQLRGQLTRTVNSLIQKELVSSTKMDPLSDDQARLLCQIVLAGCADKVARKMPQGTGQADSKLKNAYEGTKVADPLFIHPSSVLFRDLPEFIVYQETVETTKLYMKAVVAVEPHWLPIFAEQRCRFDDPLEDPPPHYCEEKGLVLCQQTSSFGPRGWVLPAVTRPFPACERRFRWFARFFLEGRVAPALEKYAPTLLSSPAIMIKSWSRLQPRTQTLLSALAREDAWSRDALSAAFRKDKEFLLKEYLEWLPEALHPQVKDAWPPSI